MGDPTPKPDFCPCLPYLDWAGIFCIGVVFGFLLFYSMRHTSNFNLDSLVTALGAGGGATLLALADKYPHWIGPYGIGFFLGFLWYFLLAKRAPGDPKGKRAAFLQKIGSP